MGAETWNCFKVVPVEWANETRMHTKVYLCDECGGDCTKGEVITIAYGDSPDTMTYEPEAFLCEKHARELRRKLERTHIRVDADA